MALGAFLFATSLILHPLVLDPAAESAAYRTIAAYGLWSAIHWCALAGLTLWTLPLVGDAATSPAARQALAVGLALWAAVLSFEAVALPRLALAGVPGLWGWTRAVAVLAVAGAAGLTATAAAVRRWW
jgi:hypothetical protein